MDFGDFFLLGPLPETQMEGHYSLQLVLLSYLIATLASYVALDIAARIRTTDNVVEAKTWWLTGGALAMGMGIWTMHFIGMLAYIMHMPMSYNPTITILSLIVAIIASAFALFLIKNPKLKSTTVIFGGVFIALGIVSMHYIGMSAMVDVTIRYLPGLFFLSIVIALIASEAALWLMIKSCSVSQRYNFLMKIGSSMVMGLAICGMHYTGMEAAVFTEEPLGINLPQTSSHNILDPGSLSFYIAAMTIIIISIALLATRSWMNALQKHNQKLLDAEAVLEQKKRELEELNTHLVKLISHSKANEDRIRAILSAAADGILVVNIDGIIEMSNQAVERIFGYSQEEALGIHISKLITFDQEGFDQEETPFLSLACLEENKDVLLELTGQRKDLKKIPLEVNFSKSLINGKYLYVIILRDITERKAAEETLNNLNTRLVTTARLAGMTEVATCMLHNVGNLLNNVNISIQTLRQRHEEIGSKTDELLKISHLLKENSSVEQLENFLKENRIGQILPDYLMQLSDYWKNEQKLATNELELLNSKIQRIAAIIAMQQSLSGNSQVIERINIHSLLEDALAINSDMIDKFGIEIKKTYSKTPPIDVDKVKLMQILVNLVKNAIEAIIESKNDNKLLEIKTTNLEDSGFIQIEITDNGIGIKEEFLTEIFTYGFTTKKKGHGFGLHASSLSIQEMQGSLQAVSKGINEGATFIIKLPKKLKMQEVGQLSDKESLYASKEQL